MHNMGKAKQSQFEAEEILSWLTDRQKEMVASVREIVLRESPTHEKKACDELAEYLAHEFECLGGEIKLHRQREAGNHLQVNFAGRERRRPVLLLGHFDTVYELRTLETMPWSEHQGQLHGPGVFDMKAGIVQMMFALWALRECKGDVPRPVKVLLVSDEEAGSATSRDLTEKVAKQCAAVLVCEPAGPGGALKTARKGVGAFRLTVTGQAAHSGLDFEKGQSAILELAHQIQALSRMTDLERGITLNVGVVRGGTRTNVVAGEAVAELDLRIANKNDGAEMERRVHRLRPVNRKCKLAVEGGINRPPLERTKDVATLFALARAIAGELRHAGCSTGKPLFGGGRQIYSTGARAALEYGKHSRNP